MSTWNLLSPAQANASRRVLDEESTQRRHVAVSLSGAHAYGFPSPDSDVDVKAVHVDSARRFLGLHAHPTVAERLEWVDGIEVDYSSNELGGVLAGALKGNGNFIERIAGPCILAEGFAFDELRTLVLRNLSRRVHNHYRGFASAQRREWDATGKAKKALYVLRTTLTGRHMLLTGEVVTDVTALLDDAGFGEGRELVARKLQGEQTALPFEERERWNAVLDRAFVALDDGLARSTLPEEPAHVDALDALLVDVRLRTLGD